MNERRATALLIANLKGSKNKPSNLLEFAEAVRFLVNHKKWGIDKVSKFFEVSEYQLRQINKINDLSPEIRKLISAEKLGIESAYQIWRLDKKLRNEAAKEAVMLNAHEVRQFIHLLMNDDKMSPKEARKLVEKSLRNKINLITIPLSLQTYNVLNDLASESKQKVSELIVQVVEDYLYANRH